ncbi:MAG: hypothetical protein HYS27_09460 [Deltaproteobacteria bacterium]|nr:hypothetical protein [Deltaproteobacteria bacterium]
MTDRAVATALLAPLLLALALSWSRLLGAGCHVPHDGDYFEARRVLEAQRFTRGTDALAVLPPWSLRPFTVLGDLEPISGDALADQPLQRYARLFVLVEPDAEDDHDALVARLGAPAAVEQVGRVVVERWDLPPPSVTFDFRARLAEATVTLGRERCDQPVRGGVGCGGDRRLRVTREWLLVSENADDAVWSRPPPRGQTLEIAWDAVPLGEALLVRAGFTRDGADRARAPVRVTVWADDVEVGRVVREPAFAFTTSRLDTHALLGTSARVRFVVDTDDAEGADFAWDAIAVGGGP